MLRERGRDLNMRAAALHMAGDALGSLAVLSAGAVLVADPSLRVGRPGGVAGRGRASSWSRPTGSCGPASTSCSSPPPPTSTWPSSPRPWVRVPGVAEVHDLHVWSLSSDVRALSAHVVLSGHPTLEEAQVVGDHVKAAIGAPFTIAHSTLELECERCIDGEVDPCLMDTVSDAGAAPTR